VQRDQEVVFRRHPYDLFGLQTNYRLIIAGAHLPSLSQKMIASAISLV
jgi:hypothetical protein